MLANLSNSNNIGFSSQKLGAVSLKKAGFLNRGVVSAHYSKLDLNDPKDVMLLNSVGAIWGEKGDNPSLRLFQRMQERFKIGYRDQKYLQEVGKTSSLDKDVLYLSVQLDPEHDNPKNVLGLMKLTKHGQNTLRIDYLVSNPVCAASKFMRSIKGTGEAMFAKAMQIAYQNGFDNVKWYSSCNDFYLKVLSKNGVKSQFVRSGKGQFCVNKAHLPIFLDKFDKKNKSNLLVNAIEPELTDLKSGV